MTRTGPSPHLSWAELACKDGAQYPLRWRATRGRALGEVFEALRHACGDKPIRIISGYRSPAHNRKVGGAKASQHMEGRALDLAIPDGLTLDQFEGIALALARTTNLRGIGRYPSNSSLHIDIRPTTRIVRWHGSRAWSEER